MKILDRVYIVLILLIYRLLLDISYIKFISYYYSYAGFVLSPAPVSIIISSYILVVITALLYPLSNCGPSNIIIALLYLIDFVPATTLTALAGCDFVSCLSLMPLYIILFGFSLISPTVNFKISLNGVFLYIFVSTFVFLWVAIFAFKFGFKFPGNLIDVYDTREEFVQVIGKGASFLSYIMNWQGNIIVPLLISWGIIAKKYYIALLGIVFNIFLFAVTGHKSQFYSIFFIIWILMGVRYVKKNIIYYMAFSLSSLIIIFCLIDYCTGSYFLNGIFIRRLLFVPSGLYYLYYDFFSNHSFTLFSQSKPFSWFVSYPYKVAIPHLIAQHYLNSSQTYANANVWADGFASWGLAGMIIIALIMVILLKIIDIISVNKNIYLVNALIAMPAFCFTNSGLFTTILGHGLLFAIFINILLPEDNFDYARRRPHENLRHNYGPPG